MWINLYITARDTVKSLMVIVRFVAAFFLMHPELCSVDGGIDLSIFLFLSSPFFLSVCVVQSSISPHALSL